ncbi:MAG TPA: hypothetical protein VMW72_11605 [Sedimentisphaerales bacterium]|nr:hypothetical protein [Sedimentisphaerales bacterium]
MTEVREQKTEDGRQKSEERRRRIDDGGWKAKHGWVPGRRAFYVHPVG